ncbi:uncharacterized protein A4U43_C08F16800 [Asparagus officinalis]|nr:uncharacterized protein A4U43_C08F16800 [Asparagus officinalis]
MLWVFYGLPFVTPNSTLVVTINGAGLALETLYLLVFFTYASKSLRLKVLKILGVELLFMAAVIGGVMGGAHTHEKRSLIVGVLCVIFGTCMYASPLAVMIPNGLGALFGACQLILYCCYYKSTPKKKPKSSKTDIEMPTVDPNTVNETSAK